MRTAKKKYIMKQDRDWESNTNKFWKNVKLLFPKNNTDECINLQDNEGNTLTNKHAANKLSSHFAMEGQKL